jgi:EAL domain-containing protein (putative c-di-GMP-specific phosphodiesterase class I)
VEIADTLTADLTVAGRRVQPVVRAAVALSRLDSTAITLLRDADVAMSEARDDEFSGVVVFDQAMSHRALAHIVLADELRNALEADEFDLHFQPIVALDDRRLVATEALLRWRHPEQGVLAPPSFLSVAEKSRLIRRIGREVLTQACLALNAMPPHALQVGVNVSAVELADDSWLAGVLQVIEESGVDPCCLVLELTETSVLSAKRDIRRDMRHLRSLGIGLFLDDFGTGYSSLSLLYDLPVSGIKLDKSFVTMVSQGDEYGIALTRGIGDLMGRLGLVGVAEGIERPEDAERLLELGWGFGQGYAFGWPIPFGDFSSVHVGRAPSATH